MLDQQNGRAIAPNVFEQLPQGRGFRRVHAGGGLVERKQLRLGRERARNFEATLIAVGKVLREIVRALVHADILEELVGPALDPPFFLARTRVAENRAEDGGPRAHVSPDHHVFERRKIREQADVLKCARNAARGDFVGLQAGERRAVEREHAGVCAVNAGQHVEERRLAGAVGTDQPDDLAAAYRNRDIAVGD